MNIQTIIMNRKNAVEGFRNTKYVYRFPQKLDIDSQEIALASLNMYYSWRNIRAGYNNNTFTYVWWNHLGVLNSVQTIVIPDGYYSISTLSAYIQSQMSLRGHYLKDSRTQNKVFFISLIENATYYACEMSFTSMYAKGSADASVFVNENPPTQVYDANGNLVWKGWDYPATKQFPQVVFSETGKIKEFLGFKIGTYPAVGTTVSTTFDLLGQIAPQTYPVSAINIQCNFCKSLIAIPENVLYSFSQGNASYGELIEVHPQNLIWCPIKDGGYNELELTFVDQDFESMEILDPQVNIMILIRDV